MRAHGFRIYLVQLLRDRRKDQPASAVHVGATAQKRVVELLEALAGDTQFIEGRSTPEDEPQRPASTLSVSRLVEVRTDLFHLLVEMGEVGSHTKARSTTKEATDISETAAEAPHFVTVIFPEGEADTFVVVAQVTRRSDPTKRLLNAMQKLDLARKKAHDAAGLAERAEVRDARQAGRTEDPVPRKVPYHRYYFDARQAADNEYLDQILSDARSVSAYFTHSAPSDRGGSSMRIERQLQINLLDDRGRDVVRNTGRSWFSGRAKPKSKAEGVSELAGLLGEEGLLEEDEAGRYDQAAVKVKGESGDTTRIAVDTLRDVFTYPVSDGVPTVSFFYGKVCGRLADVKRQASVLVADFSPEEVEECLDGLTPDL